MLEDIPAVEVAALVEVIVDRGVDSGKLLESLHVSELRHRTLSSSERLMGVLGPIVQPTTAYLRPSITDYIHRSAALEHRQCR